MVSRQLGHGGAPAMNGRHCPCRHRVQVGGFTLTDHRGASFGNAELAGRPSLVFFGFTHCPDVCLLDPGADGAACNAILHSNRCGCCSSPWIHSATTSWRCSVMWQRSGSGLTGTCVGEDAATRTIAAEPGRSAQGAAACRGSDYAVDHSATLYYINAKGALSAVFTPRPLTTPRCAATLPRLVAGALVNPDIPHAETEYLPAARAATACNFPRGAAVRQRIRFRPVKNVLIALFMRGFKPDKSDAVLTDSTGLRAFQRLLHARARGLAQDHWRALRIRW